jgi:hypothetical protein
MILISLLPVLLLVVSANGFGAPDCSHNRPGAASGIFGGKQVKHDTATFEPSLVQTARRWSRRVNMASGAEEFVSPATTTQSCFGLSDQTESADFPRLTTGLAQCWQFLWRTALAPRAPSLVS